MIDFADLAGSTGYSGSLKEVFDRQNRRVMTDFIASFRVLEEESPEIVKNSGFSEYFEQLSKLSGPTVAWLFRLPTVAFWCDVLQKLILRQAHRNLAAGHPAAHLREFGRFVLAAYLYEGHSGDIKVPLDRGGRLYLPGLKGVVLCPKKLLLTDLMAHLDDEFLTLSVPDGREATIERSYIVDNDQSRRPTLLHLAPGFRYRHLAIASDLFEVSNGDSYLRLPERVSYEFQVMTKPQESRWVKSLEQAWDVVRKSDPLVANEITNIVQVMVPVVSDSPDIHLSSSFAELPRGFYMSWHSDPLVLAEAIVHEYCHVKLNALLEIDPLLTGSTEEEIFYSPWRDDPRPLSGILHAVYAFSGVTRFWRAYLDRLESESRLPTWDWVPSRIVKSVLQLEYAVNSLRQRTALTEAGNALVESLAQETLQMKARLPNLPADEDAFVHKSVQDHFEQWQKRHQGLSVERSSVAPQRQDVQERLPEEHSSKDWIEGCIGLALSDESDVLVLTDQDCKVGEVTRGVLGYQVHFPVNPLAEGVHQKDHLMDDLFTLFQDSPTYDSVRETVFAHSATKSPLCTYIQGVFNYIEGNYLTSAENFFDAISIHTDNVDLWRYFAFALRHSGHYAASNAIFFHLSSCITYTQRNFVESHVKSYEGWKCRDCSSLVLHTLPVGYSQCSSCSGTSLIKGSFNIPVSLRCGLSHVATGLERLSKVNLSN